MCQLDRSTLPFVSALALVQVLALAGCGGPPPPEAPEPMDEPERPMLGSEERAEARAERAQAAPPPGMRLGAFTHLWTQETKDWNSGLLLAKEGDLLAFAGRNVRVHARDDGRILHTASACSPVTEDAVAWVSETRFLLVCDAELRAFSWPKLGSEKVVAFPKRVDQAAIGGGIVAVAEDGFFASDKKGKLRILSAKDGGVIDESVPPGEVESLVVAPDGSKVIFSTESEVYVRDLRTKTSRPIRKTRAARGFGFSADGASLFGDFSSFTASVVDPETGAPKEPGPWEVGSWITAVRWVDGRSIAATGSDGLAIFERGQKLPSPIKDLGEGLAVSKDGGTLCAAGRSGRVACFAKAAPGPTTMAAAFPTETVPEAQPGGTPSSSAPGSKATPPTKPSIDGKLLGRQGKKLIVSIDPAQKIEVGSTGEVSKAFQTSLGFGQITGWIVIAEVRVVSVAAGKVTLDIVSEKSSMSMNGRPVNHFTPGEVRLTLSPPP